MIYSLNGIQPSSKSLFDMDCILNGEFTIVLYFVSVIMGGFGGIILKIPSGLGGAGGGDGGGFSGVLYQSPSRDYFVVILKIPFIHIF